MRATEPLVFTLDQFEGPLDFLYYLVSKNELDLADISLKQITAQYLGKLASPGQHIEAGAEFLGIISLLLWLKSRRLLPQPEEPSPLEAPLDPRFEIIHQLLEYCRFKEAGKELQEREQRQHGCYMRGVEEGEAKRPLGIEHLSLSDLSALFRELMKKASAKTGKIKPEVWLVSDKISLIRQRLQRENKIPFEDLFAEDYCREELVVLFLALLELMKLGEVFVSQEAETQSVMVHLVEDR